MSSTGNCQTAIVIPFYKNREPLLHLLASIAVQSNVDFSRDLEIIVVDDGCSDTELADIVQSRFPHLQINCLSYSENRGSAYARNFGWQNSQAEDVIFLDADQILQRDFVYQHTQMLEQAMPIPVLQIGLRNDVQPEKIEQTDDLTSLDMQEDVRFRVFERFSENLQAVKGAWHLCFSHNISIKRQYLVEYGGFEENIFKGWGLEDCEFAYRLQKEGVKLVYNPNILVYHLSHPVSWNSDAGYKAWNENLLAFSNKHPDTPVLLQSIFRDFFDLSKRQARIDAGDKRPWLTCYQKFEEAVRIALDRPEYKHKLVLKNPSEAHIIEQLLAQRNTELIALVPKQNTKLVTAIQVRHEFEDVALYTY